MKIFNRIYLNEIFLFGIVCVLAGCTLFIDTSIQARHNWWLEDAHKRIEKNPNMYAPYWRNKNKDPRFMGSRTLPNGNIEDQYFDSGGAIRGVNGAPVFYPCHYFYEYEPKSGLIVNFRFEEKEKYDCRATGA